MAQVISATTKLAARSRGRLPAGAQVKYQRFVAQAETLLQQARQYAAAGRMDQALEVAYQAGLRTAGARVAGSVLAKRKRLPSSAWDRLALLGGDNARWARCLSDYSRIRSRLASGLEREVSDSTVFALMDQVAQFFTETATGIYLDGGDSVAA